MIHDYEKLKNNLLAGHIEMSNLPVSLTLLDEVELLRELVWDLMMKARDAPCLASHPGELTYHCDPKNVCKVCEWRDEVDEMLHDGWSMPDGLWSAPTDIEMIHKEEK